MHTHATPHQRTVYTQLQRATAMASGLESLATQALRADNTSPQLDYIADLAAHLTEHLNGLTTAYAELPDNG